MEKAHSNTGSLPTSSKLQTALIPRHRPIRAFEGSSCPQQQCFFFFSFFETSSCGSIFPVDGGGGGGRGGVLKLNSTN